MRKLSLTKLITYGAMCVALSVLAVYAAAVLPTMKLACMFVSSIFIYVLTLESAYAMSLVAFAATSAICFIIVPDRMYAGIYTALLGHFAIFRTFINGKTADKVLEFCLRILYCNLFTGAALYIAAAVFAFDLGTQIADIALPVWAIIAILEAGFVLFDILHWLCERFYNECIRRYLVPRR